MTGLVYDDVTDTQLLFCKEYPPVEIIQVCSKTGFV